MIPNESFLSSKTLPYLPKTYTTTNAGHHSRTMVSNKFHSSYVGPETTKHGDRSFGINTSWGGAEDHSPDHYIHTLENEGKYLSGSPNPRRRLAVTRSLALTRGKSQQEVGSRNNFLDDEQTIDTSISPPKRAIKLPSITSLSPKKGISSQTTINAVSIELDEDNNLRRVEVPMTDNGSLTNGGYIDLMGNPRSPFKPKRNSAIGRARPVPIVADHLALTKLDTRVSLEDSLAMEIANKDTNMRDSTLSRKITANIMKKALSQINTTRSNYVNSLNQMPKPDYMDSILMDDYGNPNLRLAGSRQKDIELKGRDDYGRFDSGITVISKDEPQEESKSSKPDSNTRDETETIGIGSTLQTLSTKSMSTVYTVEAPSRYVSLKSIGSGMRMVEGDLEYYGAVTKLHLLGGGSQAKVYLCKIKEFDDLVALKQYNIVKSQQYGGQSYEALKNEFHMLRQLEHPNVIKYHCLYRSKKKSYTNCVEFGVIMEYMPGGSLETYIERNFSSLSFQTKKKMIKQILEGLDYLHKNNIIHRDLKPENLLLTDDKSQVKISDFGISTQTSTDLNAPRSMVGTPWYMAPEIINEEPYSYKADIWSAGCCFMHLLTGKKPYHMANAVQAMLLMTNYKSPLEACEEETLRDLEKYKGLTELLNLCFSRDKNERLDASQLLGCSFFAEE